MMEVRREEERFLEGGRGGDCGEDEKIKKLGERERGEMSAEC